MRILRTSLALAFLLPWPALGQVAHDGETNPSGHSGAATSHTIAKTTAGTNRLGIVQVRISVAGYLGGEPSSVTWNGVSMTEIGTGVNSGNHWAGAIRSYYIVAPPTSSSNVVINTPGGTAVGYCISSYNGVDQTTPVDGNQTATGTSTTPSVTVTSATNDMVVSAATVGNVFSANGSGQTQNCAFNDGGNYNARSSWEAGASSVVSDYTVSSDTWAIQGFNINAAAAAGSAVPTILSVNQ